MKKIIILLVSSLLVACLAGTAFAFPSAAKLINAADQSDISDITTTLDTHAPLSIQYVVTKWTDTEGDRHYDYQYSAKPLPDAKNHVIGASTDIKFTPPANPSFYLPVGPGTDFISPDKITIEVINRVTEPDGTPAVYQITINGENAEISLATASTDVKTAIPEFPTVALPVAAILGLVFVFGRKKGDL